MNKLSMIGFALALAPTALVHAAPQDLEIRAQGVQGSEYSSTLSTMSDCTYRVQGSAIEGTEVVSVGIESKSGASAEMNVKIPSSLLPLKPGVVFETSMGGESTRVV